ncbi:hypothetical protein AB0D38_46115, partial [Streptomyces sp. NPDC048279]
PPAALADATGRARAGRVLADALTQVLAPAGPPPTVHLDLDSSAVSEAVAAAVTGIRVHPPEPAAEGPNPDGVPEEDDPAGTGRPLPPYRTGCLGPALTVARAVTAHGGGERLVVCATGAGQVALVRVSPVPPPPHTGVTPC